MDGPVVPERVSYICGDDGAKNSLNPGELIQCRECGYHIMYKKRIRIIFQYEDHWGHFVMVALNIEGMLRNISSFWNGYEWW